MGWAILALVWLVAWVFGYMDCRFVYDLAGGQIDGYMIQQSEAQSTIFFICRSTQSINEEEAK